MGFTTATRSRVLFLTLFTAVLCKPGTVRLGINDHVPQSKSSATDNRNHDEKSQTRCGACRYNADQSISESDGYAAIKENDDPLKQSNGGIIKLRHNRRSMMHAGNSDAEFEGNVDGGIIFSGGGSLTVDGNVAGGIILSGKGIINVSGNVEDGIKFTGEGSIDIGGNLRGDIIAVGKGSVTVNGKHSVGLVHNLGEVTIKIKGN